jgi:hypothetical protein
MRFYIYTLFFWDYIFDYLKIKLFKSFEQENKLLISKDHRVMLYVAENI